VQPKGKIPYTQAEDEIWHNTFSLGVDWSEFDPDNFDEDEDGEE